MVLQMALLLLLGLRLCTGLDDGLGVLQGLPMKRQRRGGGRFMCIKKGLILHNIVSHLEFLLRFKKYSCDMQFFFPFSDVKTQASHFVYFVCFINFQERLMYFFLFDYFLKNV